MNCPDGYSHQTFTVEYSVPGDLDGLTLSPAISAPSRPDDPHQIYRPEVPGDLGLINPDYVVAESGDGRLGVIGDRRIGLFWLDSPVLGDPGAALEVVDALSGSVVVQQLVASLVGLGTYYNNTGFLVPQGSLIRISGFTNVGVTPIRIRFHSSYVVGL